MEYSKENEHKENEIYQKLESNKLLFYEKITNNKIFKDFPINEKEKECFSTIMSILKKNNLTSIICRVVGGWVRDKLLGKESDDIDIVINDMPASEFTLLINQELYTGKLKMGIIPKNLAKGKLIEVATTNIFNTQIDIVNLRNNDQNQIPTPLSDALRRDLSINSLFYNINEEKVEDFSGRGIKDLEQGIIDTPIEAEIALRDDSFIVLRMLRFAIKYKFKISNDINNYIEKNRDYIISNFYKKVSKERIEKELFKILKLENSRYAIAYFYIFHILDIIILIKNYDKENNYDKIFLKATNLYILGEYLLEKNKIFDIEMNSDNFNKVNYSLLLLTLYFRDKKDKNVYINQKILKHTYRTSNENQRANSYMCRNFDELLKIINEDNYERLKIAKIIKKINSKNIIPCLFACIAYEYIENVELISLLYEIDENILQKFIDKIKKFFDYIIKEDLLYIEKMKVLIDGKELKEILNIKLTKEVGTLIEYLIDEQIRNPKLNREQAIELIKKKKEEISFKNKDN